MTEARGVLYSLDKQIWAISLVNKETLTIRLPGTRLQAACDSNPRGFILRRDLQCHHMAVYLLCLRQKVTLVISPTGSSHAEKDKFSMTQLQLSTHKLPIFEWDHTRKRICSVWAEFRPENFEAADNIDPSPKQGKNKRKRAPMK